MSGEREKYNAVGTVRIDSIDPVQSRYHSTYSRLCIAQHADATVGRDIDGREPAHGPGWSALRWIYGGGLMPAMKQKQSGRPKDP